MTPSLVFVTAEAPPGEALAALIAALAPGAAPVGIEAYLARVHSGPCVAIAAVDQAGLAAMRAGSVDQPIVALPWPGVTAEARLGAGADEAAEATAESVKAHIALALARRAAYAHAPRLRHQNEALGLAARRMRELSGEPLATQLSAITELSAHELHVARAGVWRYEAESSKLELLDRYELGEDRHVHGERIEEADHREYFSALREERTIVIGDVTSDPRTAGMRASYLAPASIGAMLDVPIRAGDRTLGVLCFEHVGGPRHFNDFAQSLSAGYADLTAIMLENDARRRAVESFRESQAALEQARRIEAVGRLAGGVAHDFNNMLTVILSYADVLTRKLGPGHALAPLVSEITRAGHHATEMTAKLLSVSRTSGDPTRRTFDIVATIRELELFLRRLIGEDVHLVLELASDPVPVELDPSELEQLLMNLAINARDAMPGGGELRIAAHSEGDSAVLRVRDTGHGMPPEVKARLFEPFFTTKDPGKGTGLGLFTVYGMVRDRGGSVHVDSAKEKGTSFEVRLPLSEQAPPTRADAVVHASSIRGHETILLVEDETAVREVLTGMLRELGYHALPARDAAEALRAVEAFPGPIHLLLSDVVMPQQSGPELAKALTRARPEVRVLFVSGYDDAALRAYGLDDHARLVRKPVSRELLGAQVRRALDEERFD